MRYYTFSEILFALREEYLKQFSKLQVLKDEIGTTYADPENIYLDLVKSTTNKLDLSFAYDTRKKQRLGDRSYFELGALYSTASKEFIDRDFIWVKDKKLALDVLEEINNSDFVKYMANEDADKYNDISHPDSENKLLVWHNHLEYCNEYPDGTYRGVYYRPYEDKVYIERGDGALKFVDKKYAIYALQERIPESVFNDYQKQLLNSYETKEIEVINGPIGKYCNKYEIKEDEKRLVLKR